MHDWGDQGHLQGANEFVVAAPWPHLAVLALGLLVAVLLFVRLATVAFTSERTAV